ITRQIVEKFGLSAGRAERVAMVADQWAKLKGRELTEKDANAFSRDLIGVNISDVQAAVKKSMQGSSQDLNLLMEKAAKANETTPEQISKIMGKIFF
ncbi:MAG: hypothetical protein AABY86_16230, partial [Bdellovibrionota bacterium]